MTFRPCFRHRFFPRHSMVDCTSCSAKLKDRSGASICGTASGSSRKDWFSCACRTSGTGSGIRTFKPVSALPNACHETLDSARTGPLILKNGAQALLKVSMALLQVCPDCPAHLPKIPAWLWDHSYSIHQSRMKPLSGSSHHQEVQGWLWPLA